MTHISLSRFADSVLDTTHDIKDGPKTHLVFKSADFYVGSVEQGKLQGNGRYTWIKENVVYEGTFKDNKIQGEGKFVWWNGSKYVGEVSGNYRNGFGKFEAASGAYYEGEWLNGKFHGQGTLIFCTENGEHKYSGQWKNGLKDGKGEMHYPSGNIYIGDWKENKKEGEGKFVWINRYEVYEGQWMNDKPNGHGIHTWKILRKSQHDQPFDNYYEGSWLDGKRHGSGVFQYSTGARYEGSYENDMKSGFGVYHSENGRKYEGKWHNDKIAEHVNWDPFPNFAYVFNTIMLHENTSTEEKERGLKEVNIIMQRYSTSLQDLFKLLCDKDPFLVEEGHSKLCSQWTLIYWTYFSEVLNKLLWSNDIIYSFQPLVPLGSKWLNNSKFKITFGSFLEWIFKLSSVYKFNLIPDDEVDRYMTSHGQRLAWFLKMHIVPSVSNYEYQEILPTIYQEFLESMLNAFSTLCPKPEKGNITRPSLRDVLIFVTNRLQTEEYPVYPAHKFIKCCQKVLKHVPNSELDVLSYEPTDPEYCMVMEEVGADYIIWNQIFIDEKQDGPNERTVRFEDEDSDRMVSTVQEFFQIVFVY